MGITTFWNALRSHYLPHSTVGPTSLEATSKEGAHPQLSSDKTKSSRDGLKTTHTDSGTNEEFRADEISKKIKLEDSSNLMKDTRSTFFTLDSLQDKPIIVSDKSEEEETKKDKDTHTTSHDSQKEKLEQQKAKAEAKVASLKARPSYPDINQLNELLVATVVETASRAASINVPSAAQATASPAEGDKNTNPATKDAKPTNLHDELVYLLGIDIMTQYYNKKLLYDKYCNKMLKRRKSSKIINCDVLR
nr:hypothetical protein [Tanacetum cinerariifolium]